MADISEHESSLSGRLKMWAGYSYEKSLSYGCDLCQALQRVAHKVVESDLEIRDVDYRNATRSLGEHYLKGVLGEDNRFEIMAYWAGGWKCIRLSAWRKDEGVKKLQSVIEELPGIFRRGEKPSTSGKPKTIRHTRRN